MCDLVQNFFANLPCVSNGKLEEGKGEIMEDLKPQGETKLKTTKVYFRWYLRKVTPDEEVRVIGDCTELGNWDPDKGVGLTAFDGSYCWRSKGIPLLLLRPIQYEYVVVNKKSGELSQLAKKDQRRRAVPTGAKMTLEDDGGRLRDFDTEGDLAVESQPTLPTLRVDTSQLIRVASVESGTNMSQCSGKTPGLPRQQQFEENLEKEKALKLTSEDTVVAVFRKLPLRVERDEGGSLRVVEKTLTKKVPFNVPSLLAQSQHDGRHAFKLKFVGQPGVIAKDEAERKQIRDLLQPYNCIPVFIDEKLNAGYIEFCHKFLWPVFHNMKVFFQSSDHKFDESNWKAFKDVNKTFVEVIETALGENTLVWIHDYHLIMLPRLLQVRELAVRQRPTIGFFLHCCFPSSEVLRCIPVRVELLQSMLSCHCVTFQIFEYARHFLSCCQLILGSSYSFQEGGILQVEHDNRSIVIRADHVVLPWKYMSVCLDDNEVKSRAASMRQKFGKRTIFGAIDGDEPFAGLTLKLRAFEKLLSDCKQHRANICLVQHVLQTEHTNSGKELIKTLREMAADINNKFGKEGDPPLVSIETGDYGFHDRLAIMMATDVLLDTSINDGLNLYPFMFYCAHSKDMKGAAIVSEFTGCSNSLTGARKVNPWNTEVVVRSMDSVLTSSTREKEESFKKDHSYVSTQVFDSWVDHNLVELKASTLFKNRIQMDVGFDKHLTGNRGLDERAVLRDYNKAKVRLIFLDNEGTLSPDRRLQLRYDKNRGLQAPLANSMENDVLHHLTTLANDQKNIVVVISGRERDVLDSFFSHHNVNQLGLYAEHGHYFKLPGRISKDKLSRWNTQISANSSEDSDWAEIALDLFKQYAKRVQGSTVEKKGSLVTWYYYQVGAPEVAREMAQGLCKELDPSDPQGLMYGYEVKVTNGRGYVEVKRNDVDKGKAVQHMIGMIKQELKLDVDFILCLGDDRSDEDMFEVIHELELEKKRSRSGSDGYSSPDHPLSPKRPSGRTSLPTLSVQAEEPIAEELYYYTSTVGRKNSKAKYFVHNTDAVHDLLKKLATSSTKLPKTASAPDLKSLMALSAMEEMDTIAEGDD